MPPARLVQLRARSADKSRSGRYWCSCVPRSARARFRLVLEQVRRTHDLAGLTVTALRHLLGEPGLLHRMTGIRRQALDCRHGLSGDLRNLRLAENARWPSMCTMQAPHRPAPQPNLVPVSFKSSRITHSSSLRRRISCRRLAIHKEIGGHCYLPEISAPPDHRDRPRRSSCEQMRIAMAGHATHVPSFADRLSNRFR